MNTGNGAKPNPKSIFQKGFARDTSNEVKGKVGAPFTAKKDSHKGKANG